MRHDIVLWAALAAYCVLTALVVFSVPINAAPDEGAHLEYVEYLLKNKSLPVFEPRGANFPGYEFHQPPLYYALSAAVWALTPSGFGPYAARLVSLACGVLCLLFLWHGARLLFPQNQVLPSLATGFGALWPLHISVGASAGNDALTGALCAGIFWAIARMAARVERDEYSLRAAALIGIFFGLGMLTKSSALVVGVVGIGAAVHLGRAQSTRAAMSAGAVVAGVALLICGAWLARNHVLYGDPLAMKIFDEAFKNSSPRPAAVMAATGVSLLEYVRAYFTILFATCWGFFGGPNTAIGVLNPFSGRQRPDVAAATAFEILKASPLILACIIATLLAVWGWLKPRGEMPAVSKTAWLWWLIGFGLVCLALFRFNLIQFQAQARYLHPAFLPMCLLFAWGWQRVLPTQRALQLFSWVFGAVLVIIVLWNVVFWKTLV